MTILNMAAQRDNFFAGIAVAGAQWSTNYDKAFENGGAAPRTPQNDPISFNGFGLDSENYANWYYMISDDNILVHTCGGDPMATGEWNALAEYFANAGGSVARAQWDPKLPTVQQNQKDRALADRDTTKPSSGIAWASFTQGSHMSTWKYAYALDYPFEWLLQQTRQTEQARGKLEALKNPWLGRDDSGQLRSGSGTTGLNAAQFTPDGPSTGYTEGWTPLSATVNLIASLPTLSTSTNQNKKVVQAARAAYELLSPSNQQAVTNLDRLTQAEQQIR